ncbi:hypothetical protein KIN20_007154 [Parelaphostrongylus tenuis]|uniref:Uncharacterized protein n=1 Tax=Parelaphostrongylus tenuis TaxID=148309 RepID=A0AAD5M508_PARTN|nr:hypothetical protein KIN20_007154 [Parelaphostrongylus tenuis]
MTPGRPSWQPAKWLVQISAPGGPATKTLSRAPMVDPGQQQRRTICRLDCDVRRKVESLSRRTATMSSVVRDREEAPKTSQSRVHLENPTGSEIHIKQAEQ